MPRKPTSDDAPFATSTTPNQRGGTLWERRFKSSQGQTEAHLLSCHTDIELTTVRAGIVEHPGHYRWSSDVHNAGGETNDPITEHADVLRLVSSNHLIRKELQPRVESGHGMRGRAS